MAVKKSKIYTVTVSSSENVYDEQQLYKSIFESIYAISQESSKASVYPVPEELEKE